jgi:hypothetical protein
LHESGLKLLHSRRWRKRFGASQLAVIDRLDHFRLVGFDRIGPQGSHGIPIYRAVAVDGDSFLFRNLPWQTAVQYGEETGPVVQHIFVGRPSSCACRKISLCGRSGGAVEPSARRAT